MLNITHQGNASQNCNELSSHTCPNGCYREDKRQVLMRMWRKGNLLLGMWIDRYTMENSMEIHQKVRSRTAMHSYGLPLMVIHLNNMETLIGKYICHPVFTAALFTAAKIWKHHKCLSMDEQVKIWCVWDVYSGILLSHEDEIVLFTAPWMDLGGILVSEICQTEEDKYHVLSLMWNLRKHTKQAQWNKNKLMDTKNRSVITSGEEGWELGKNRWRGVNSMTMGGN